jgi:hypothetical protein
VTDVYGPQEATADDVVGAITAAMQTRYADPGWRSAWEHADATDDNHLRPVQREAATAAEAWAALNREGPTADAVRSYLAPGPQPRYDTPQARAEAQAEPEAGS